jgi:hypothetical protein
MPRFQRIRAALDRIDRFMCDTMGWHKSNGTATFDGCSLHSVCPYCEREVLQDSQGNWFAAHNAKRHGE